MGKEVTNHKKVILSVATFLIFVAIAIVIFGYFFFHGNPTVRKHTTAFVQGYLNNNYPNEEFEISTTQFDWYVNDYDFKLTSKKLDRSYSLSARDNQVLNDQYRNLSEDVETENRVKRQIEKQLLTVTKKSVGSVSDITVNFYIRKGIYSRDYNLQEGFKEPIRIDVCFTPEAVGDNIQTFVDLSSKAKDVILTHKYKIDKLVFWDGEQVPRKIQLFLTGDNITLSKEEILKKNLVNKIFDSHKVIN